MASRHRIVQRAVLLSFASLIACSAEPDTARLKYPAARTVDVVDDYHGTKVADPYRWLEELDSKEVREWAAAQTALALPLLRENDARPWITTRVAELRKFFEEPSEERDEAPLIDGKFLGDGKSISDIWPSPDKTYAAYAVSELGSEWVETRIRRLRDGKDLDERLE